MNMRTVRQVALFLLYILLCLFCIGSLGLAESSEAQIEALEARLKALEARVEALEAQQASPPEEENEKEEQEEELLTLGDTIPLEEGKAFVISGFDFASGFRYSPAGGFSTLTLSAKSGYQLVALYISLENSSREDLSVSRILDASIQYGSEYTNKAQESFFYLNSRGIYAGGLKTLGPSSSVDGCLLFVVPEGASESTERISVRFQIGGDSYECVLRPGGSLLPSGESESF